MYNMSSSHQLLLVMVALVSCCQGLSKLKVMHSWNSIDYHWPSHHPNATRQTMIQLGLFVPGNSIPFDVDWWNGRVFVTTPRLKPGVPATLSTVSPYGDELNPVLHPYPNWSWHRPGDCQGITSVSSIQFDSCNRLWVLDSGTIHTEDQHPQRICPPKFLTFQMSNNVLDSSHMFSHKLFKSTSVLSSFVLDVRSPASNCANMFAYIADPPTSGLIVYDHHRKVSWRVEANNFRPLPSFGYFNIDGAEFNSMLGLNALALTPNTPIRKLYYHSWSGNTENYVSAETLRSQALFMKVPISKTTQAEFTTHAKKREGQATSMAISSKGTMFFGNIPRSSITCWNTGSEFAPEKLFEVDQDNSLLRFVAGMKVVQRADGVEEVWVLSNNYHKYKTGKMDQEQVNHRIMTATVSDLVAGMAC